MVPESERRVTFKIKPAPDLTATFKDGHLKFEFQSGSETLFPACIHRFQR